MAGTVSLQRLLRACLGALGLALLWLLLGATDASADEVRPAPASPVLRVEVPVANDTPSPEGGGVLTRVVSDVVTTPAKLVAPSSREAKKPVGQRDSRSSSTSEPVTGQASRPPAPRGTAPSAGQVVQAAANRTAATMRNSAATVDAVVAAASTVVDPVDGTGAVSDVLEAAGDTGSDLLEAVSTVLDDVPSQSQPLPSPPAPLPVTTVQPPTSDGSDGPGAAAQGHRSAAPLLATATPQPTGSGPEETATPSATGPEKGTAASQGRSGAGQQPAPGPTPAPAPGSAPDGVVPGSASGTQGGHSGDSAAEPSHETILDPHAADLSTAVAASEHPAPPPVPGFRPE